MAAKVGKVAVETSAFLLCDVQEKFSSLIKYFPQICLVAQRLSLASKHLEVPLIATEHYPKALGNIVPEIDVSEAKIFPKTSFSMMGAPGFREHLFTVRPNLKSVVLYGIEVRKYIVLKF